MLGVGRHLPVLHPPVKPDLKMRRVMTIYHETGILSDSVTLDAPRRQWPDWVVWLVLVVFLVSVVLGFFGVRLLP